MLLPSYGKKLLLTWPSLIFAQRESCKRVREESLESFERPSVALRTHEGTSSRSPQVISTKLIPPAHILIWSSKPRLYSFDYETQPLWVKAAPPRVHASVYCVFAERLTAQTLGQAVGCVLDRAERFFLSESTTLPPRNWH
jgi:hypothetical protein